MRIITDSAEETKRLAEMFAKELAGGLKPAKGAATVVALLGDLGAGKTTFAQGFANGFGIREKIVSPTFVILKQYKLYRHRLNVKCFKYFYHIDCYRLESEKDAETIGLKEILKSQENLALIEWAERVKKILPKKQTIVVKFSHIDEKRRKIDFN